DSKLIAGGPRGTTRDRSRPLRHTGAPRGPDRLSTGPSRSNSAVAHAPPVLGRGVHRRIDRRIRLRFAQPLAQRSEWPLAKRRGRLGRRDRRYRVAQSPRGDPGIDRRATRRAARGGDRRWTDRLLSVGIGRPYLRDADHVAVGCGLWRWRTPASRATVRVGRDDRFRHRVSRVTPPPASPRGNVWVLF